MPRDRRRVLGPGLSAVLVLTTLAAVGPAAGSGAAIPTLVAGGIVRTSPFAGARVSMKDSEGSAYVRRDHSVWLADDDGRRLYEVSARTGKLRRTIKADDLAATRRLGGGHRAGDDRVGDMEAVAYDADRDRLFVFSGACCDESARPTVLRLTRNRRGNLALDSYQSLPAGADFSGAAWNPADGHVYVGVGPLISSYGYARNVLGTPVAVPGLTGVLGMAFTFDGASLLVVHGPALLSRVDWATRTLVPGWTFDLAAAGVPDPRAVEIVRGRLWVSDGFDFRPTGDPLDHAVFLFDVIG
jgi:hypothetical protein